MRFFDPVLTRLKLENYPCLPESAMMSHKLEDRSRCYQLARRSLLLLILALFCLNCSSAGGGDSDTSTSNVKNVHYVDTVGTNFLFRGERPLTGDGITSAVFNLDGLKRAIAEQAELAGVTLPPSYTLVVISLLWLNDVENPEQAAKERGLLFEEISFFKANPQIGQVNSWASKGTGLSPLDPSLSSVRDYLGMNLDSWLSDPQVWRVEKLRAWLENPSELGITGPVVIYVHCFGGCDRTGELIGSYAMRYMDKSWEEMNSLNKGCCRIDGTTGETIYATENCNALRWYGLWLNLKFGLSLHWDNPAKCCNL